MTIQEMKQKRYGIYQGMKELLDVADKENRSMTAEENEKYGKMEKDMDDLTSDIQKREKLDAQEKEILLREEQKEKRDFENKEKRKDPLESDEYRDAFRQFIVNPKELSNEQRNLLVEKRALSAVTGSAGGYTVPQGFYNQIMDAMLFFGGMRQARTTKLNTAAGNDLPIPTANDTGNTGELLAENTEAAKLDLAFSQIIMKAYKYSSKTILVPFELLQDSAFDLESYLGTKLGERIGRITNTHFTTGDNSSKPQGIVTGATLGKTGAAGQTTSLIVDDLLDLQHSVDVAYRQGAQFMMNDSTLKAIKKLKDSEGRLLWTPGLAVKEPDTILGHEYIINNDVAAMAASAKSVLFGDMSKYFIRNVKDIQLFRISDKYIESGQVGFLAFYRGDGRLVDAGTHPIKYYQNAAV